MNTEEEKFLHDIASPLFAAKLKLKMLLEDANSAQDSSEFLAACKIQLQKITKSIEQIETLHGSRKARVAELKDKN